MKNIGVIISGCGYLDGAEIREAVLTLLSIDKYGARPSIYAPNVDQYHVVNHLTGEETGESRNVLLEAGRIARGEVIDLSEIKMNELDALIIPGGFGVAKNLSSLAFEGQKGSIHPVFSKVLKDCHDSHKPIGAICISPAVICMALGKAQPELTIGNDTSTAGIINELGGKHIDCDVHQIHTDKKNKIVSTPAYMYGDAPISRIAQGIDQCVKEVINLI